jgi:two-component system, NtrC family, sensor kinase
MAASRSTPSGEPRSGARTRALPRLRTELLATIAFLAIAALVLAVASVALVFARESESHDVAWWVALIVAIDGCVFVAYGAWQVRRLVSQPLEAAIATAEAIAGGDLTRRMPRGETRELAALADSVNRMTDHLIEAQVQHLRIEKLASVGRLAAGIAHEIGNPLGAIHGYIHIARTRASDQVGVAEALDGLERESLRIDRIVRGLLDYARPRRGTPMPIDVNDVVRGATGLLRDQGVLRRVQVAYGLDEHLPPLFGERHELEQVMVNLLLNAVDAMDGVGALGLRTRLTTATELRNPAPRRDGDTGTVRIERGPTARVEAWLDRVGDPARIIQVIVADSGPGVPAADEERIFDPFFTTKEPGQGTGLGLAIVARIVDGLQGTVWVQRAREGGAAFVMLFAVPQLPTPAPRVATPDGAAARPVGGRP